MKWFNALVQKIKKILQRIRLSLLHKHATSESRDDEKVKDFRSSLMDYIENATEGKEVPEKVVEFGKVIPESPDSNPHQQEYHKTGEPHVFHGGHVKELSDYFKSRRKAYDKRPGIVDLLKHSVWEHIHASIHCAHRGEKHNAKMHLDIANSACSELAHHMQDSDHAAFMDTISSRLKMLSD